MADNINSITKQLLELVAPFKENFKGAYSVRQDGACAQLKSTEHVQLIPKKDKPGLDIHILPNTLNETVYIPACVTKGDIDDLVYNDFYIGENAFVTIVAGCGVHTDDGHDVRHNGIHFFHLAKGAHVVYEENHVGTGEGSGGRSIDPVTEVEMEENAYLEMNTYQIGGVDKADRKTKIKAGKGARLVINERILTNNEQEAKSVIYVELNGEGSKADIVSHSIAKDKSFQLYDSTIVGNAPCKGHTECDSIIDGDAVIDAIPRLYAKHRDAELIHEAAIGKIAGEQLLKLRTLGLTEEEAEAQIIEGFLA